MTKYGKSPWIDQFPKSRVPSYPKHRGDSDTTVAIVGGGLTGCLTAYGLAAGGEKVVLLEADQIGRGTTAVATGWIAEEPDVSFHELEKTIGLRAARRAFQAWRRAALDFAALVRRLDVKCHLELAPTATVATRPEQISGLKKDQKARREAGLDAASLNARAIRGELHVDATVGLKAKDSATLDPYRACVGIAAAAAARGAQIFEHSPVRRITFNRKTAKVLTASGTIGVRRVVIATGMPTTTLFSSLARHFWFRTTYSAVTDQVPARIRRTLGPRHTVIRDSAVPRHILRWLDDERLIVTGADTDAALSRQEDKIVVQRTGQLMYELSVLYPDISGIQPAYGWSANYARTADGLPYIGPHRNFPHHLFAFGDSSHGVTAAYLASRILLRHCINELDPADEAFGFHR